MGGWWRLDKVIEPSLQLVCSRAHEVVPAASTPIEVEAYDSDHEVSDQVTAVPRRVTSRPGRSVETEISVSTVRLFYEFG